MTSSEPDATWLIMGGTSGIGRKVVEEAIKADIKVRAFGRSANAELFGDGVEPFAGDALNVEDVRRALEGVNVVVQALGVKERPAMLWEEETLFSSATSTLLPLIEEMGIKRLITVTGYGAGESADTMSSLARLGHGAVLGKVYADKTRQEELIKATDLDWTLVRPTVLTNTPASRRYSVLTDPSSWHMGVISRADVADFVVRCGRDASHIQQAVVLA